ECRCNKRCTHGMRRVSSAESNVACVFFQYPVNHIRMQVSPAFLRFAISSPYWPEEWTFKILTVSGHCQVTSDAPCGLRMNRETPLLATLAYHTERIVPAINMEVTDIQPSDL